jgi:hypothetical protein
MIQLNLLIARLRADFGAPLLNWFALLLIYIKWLQSHLIRMILVYLVEIKSLLSKFIWQINFILAFSV